MSAASIRADGEGRYRVDGDLVFATVSKVLSWPDSLPADSGALVVDLQGVEHADSAGLALILEWADLAASRHKGMRFANLPESLVRIAELTNLDSLLPMVETGG